MKIKNIYKIIIFIFLFFISSSNIYAESSTGFLPGQIWYSNDDLVEGNTVSIYTAVWNADANPISMRVEFYDKNVILGYRNIEVPVKSLVEVSLPWKVTSGDHSISAKIISPKLISGTKKEPISLNHSETNKDKKFIPVMIKSVNASSLKDTVVAKNSLGDIPSKINEVLPTSVSNLLLTSISKIENIRQDLQLSTEKSKEEIQKNIKVSDVVSDLETFIKNDGATVNGSDYNSVKNSNDSSLNKSKNFLSSGHPFEYVKLFFLSSINFILKNQVIFYSLLFLLCIRLLGFVISFIRNR